MDGYEATRRIKATEQGQRTKVIALTASAFEEDRHKVIAAGCDDFVRKPFREEEVCEMLERHLGVGFTYEEAGVAEGIDQHSATPLTADDLAVLPGELLTALHRASMQADDEAVRAQLPEDLPPDELTLERALELLEQAGCAPVRVTPIRPSMDDVFIALVGRPTREAA